MADDMHYDIRISRSAIFHKVTLTVFINGSVIFQDVNRWWSLSSAAKFANGLRDAVEEQIAAWEEGRRG